MNFAFGGDPIGSIKVSLSPLVKRAIPNEALMAVKATRGDPVFGSICVELDSYRGRHARRRYSLPEHIAWVDAVAPGCLPLSGW